MNGKETDTEALERRLVTLLSSVTAKRFRSAVPTDAYRTTDDFCLASHILLRQHFGHHLRLTIQLLSLSECRATRRDGGCSFRWSRTANRDGMEGWEVDFVRCQQQLHSLFVIIMQ